MASLEPGKPLSRWEHTPPPLGPSDIDIQVTHNGLCHTDAHMIDNDWGISGYPFIPGHEVVGVVAAKGSDVKSLEIGQRVGYAWMKGSCGDCIHCVQGMENICLAGHTGLILFGGKGGFQNFLRAPAKFAFPIPDALDSVSAAPLLCAGVTVYGPLSRLITHPGTKVAVIGIGGLGHLALQFADKMGAEVTAISSSADKEAEARKFGADHFVVSGSEAEKALVNTFEVVVNTVSSATDFKQQLKLLRPNGSLCIVGLPVCDINIGVLDLVASQKQVVGSLVGGRKDMLEMLQFAAAKGIRPQCETMPLSQANEAIAKMRANKARYRYVLTTDL